MVFSILGSTQALADAALMIVYQSMLNGPLRGLLGITYVMLIDTPTPVPTTSYYYNYPTTWTSGSYALPSFLRRCPHRFPALADSPFSFT